MTLGDMLRGFIQDSWYNVVSGIGTSRDKRVHSRMTRDAYFDEEKLATLYEDDIFRRICTILPDEGTREWIRIPSDTDSKILTKLADLDAQSKLKDAWTWAQAFGGGVVAMTLDDGLRPEDPLDISKVKDITRLDVYNRFRLYPIKHYIDPKHPKFKQPAVYRISYRDYIVGTEPTSLIHESRLLQFNGILSTESRRIENLGWGDSLIARTYDLVRDYGNTYRSVFAFMDEFGVSVYKFKNLAALLASDKQNVVLERLSMIDAAKSMIRGVPLDSDNESYERASIVLSGLDGVLDRIDGRLSAGVGIPQTLLFGKAQGGLNSTGEGDQRNWYNKVASAQVTTLRKPLMTLISVCAKAVGSTDKGNGFIFNPLWAMTDKDREETRFMTMQRDEIAMKAGVLTPAEVRESRFGGDQFSYETHVQDKSAIKPRGDIYQVAAVMKLVSEGTITPDAATRMLVAGIGFSEEDAASFTKGAKASQSDMVAPKQIDVNEAHRVSRANENSPNKT